MDPRWGSEYNIFPYICQPQKKDKYHMGYDGLRGEAIHTLLDIQREAVKHFGKAYSRKEAVCAEDEIWGVELYPTMFDDDTNEALCKNVTKE